MNRKNINLFSIFALLFSLAFYLFFAFFDGAVICVDSPGYIEMNISREPFYPLFLALFRLIFKNADSDFYLTAVAFAQSILAAVAAWSLAMYLKRQFRLSRTFSFLILLIPLSVSILCRFAARRGAMYSNSILTEGIAISCYILFFRWLFEYLICQSKKSFFCCCALVFILISTRKQMIISLALLAIAVLYLYFRPKKLLRGITITFLTALCILSSNIFLDLGYNYLLRGELTRHSSDSRFVTTMAFYTADRDDSKYIADAEISELFLKIYDICDENEFLMNSAGQGWLNRVSHFGDCYDHIQIDTMWPLVNEYAEDHYSSDIVSLNKHADQIMDCIDRSIIPHNIFKIVETFTDNFLSGLITTVAQRRPVLIGYSIFIYCLYFCLLIYHFIYGKCKKILLFSTFTLISIIINVGLVSLVIFCQTRYTIYNMALFYISFLLMLYEPIARVLKGRTNAV